MNFPLFAWGVASLFGVVLMGSSLLFRIADQNMSDKDKHDCNLINLGGIALLLLPVSIVALVIFGFVRGLLFVASEAKKFFGE